MSTEKTLSNTDIATHFIKATLVVINTMSGIDASVGKPYVKKNHEAAGEVSAIVSVSGEKKGSIAVSFTKSCALALVKGMLGNDIQDPKQDTYDAVGEISNMISGQARASLTEVDLLLQGSTPTVISGDNHQITHTAKAPVMAIPFQTASGNFTVEFCFE